NSIEIRDPAGHEDVGVNSANDGAQGRRIRPAAAMRQDEPPNPKVRQAADQLRQRWSHAPAPWKGGDPIWPWIEPDRQPVAGDRDAFADQLRLIDDAHREDDARGPGREGEADLIGALEAAGYLDRDRDTAGDAADRLEIDRRARPGALEVDEMDHARTLRRESLGDDLRPVRRRPDSGCGPGPRHDPRAALLEVDRGDHLHARWSWRRVKSPVTRRDRPGALRPAAVGDGS